MSSYPPQPPTDPYAQPQQPYPQQPFPPYQASFPQPQTGYGGPFPVQQPYPQPQAGSPQYPQMPMQTPYAAVPPQAFPPQPVMVPHHLKKKDNTAVIVLTIFGVLIAVFGCAAFAIFGIPLFVIANRDRYATVPSQITQHCRLGQSIVTKDSLGQWQITVSQASTKTGNPYSLGPQLGTTKKLLIVQASVTNLDSQRQLFVSDSLFLAKDDSGQQYFQIHTSKVDRLGGFVDPKQQQTGTLLYAVPINTNHFTITFKGGSFDVAADWDVSV